MIMTNGDIEPEVKDVEVSYVEPAGDDEEIIESEPTDPDSSPDETDDKGDEPEVSPTVQKKPQPEPATKPEKEVGDDGLADIDGETPRERAMRAEIKRLRSRERKERSDELLHEARPTQNKPEISEDKRKILEKYKPEEIGALREAIDVLADEMGFVRKGELSQNSFVEKATEQLNAFTDKHPEYLPENDKDGTLWAAFKEEYALYKQPTDPKDFKKIFEKVHSSVFGIKPEVALNKVNAQREKINVASHKSASPQSGNNRSNGRPVASTGLRLDMLKGFDADEIDNMTGV